jgi:hypothetical protein
LWVNVIFITYIEFALCHQIWRGLIKAQKGLLPAQIRQVSRDVFDVVQDWLCSRFKPQEPMEPAVQSLTRLIERHNRRGVSEIQIICKSQRIYLIKRLGVVLKVGYHFQQNVVSTRYVLHSGTEKSQRQTAELLRSSFA